MTQELQNYINEMRDGGYKDSEIRRSLIEVGWPDDSLNALLDPIYADDRTILTKVQLGMESIVVFFAVSIVCITLGAYIFNKKDVV